MITVHNVLYTLMFNCATTLFVDVHESVYSILAWCSKYWNIFELKVHTGTVCNVIFSHCIFALEQCLMFMHSIKVSHWDSF